MYLSHKSDSKRRVYLEFVQLTMYYDPASLCGKKVRYFGMYAFRYPTYYVHMSLCSFGKHMVIPDTM